MILPDCLEDRLGHVPHRHWNFKADRARRIPQPVKMFFKPKDASVVKANALENSIAVKQTVIEDRNFRARFRIKFSIDVNLRVLDAGRQAWTTFNRRFDYCISSGLVSFR